MSEADDNVDWRQLREFADVDLVQSYVLSWRVESDTLVVDIDVFLTPDHPFYEKPRPAERVCIRPAIIEFPLCDSISAEGVSGEEVSDIAKKIAHGPIRSLRRLSSGHYELGGEFGTVLIDAERPILRLKGP